MPKGTGRPNKKGESSKDALDREFCRRVMRSEEKKIAEGDRAFYSSKSKEEIAKYQKRKKETEADLQRRAQERLNKMYPSMKGK